MSIVPRIGILLLINTLFLTLLFNVSSLQAATKMPAFSLPLVVSGKQVSSEVFANKALLITFFATWCPPCIQEVPTLIQLHQEFGPDGFSVVGLSVDQEGPKVVARLVSKYSINYPVLMADNKTTRSFGGVYGIPVSFLVNKKGNVVKRYTGYVPHSILMKDIKKVLR